ncbi:unnamed protein product [Spirodela intermedia]|uniref:HMA domain-containing protein n=1 Tax=Spirodela intermedia TaxID=51605 RepID=A0A7I8J1U8_SPIIN|nr:unnamed protein product [Spirodela intermedia]CAA6664039.1 unnamed protein product [Spirodela intermedia]
MRIFMHCEGCARKVMRSLKGFPGVETVTTDCRTHKVVVKGKVAAADPLKVVDRVEKKSGRKVELLTPIPPKPEEKKEEKEEEKPKPEEKKEEPTVISVVLKVHMHCEACLQEIKKRILKMKGVQSVDPDLKSSQVTVKGIFEPQKLVEYIYKRTGKHAAIVKTEPADKKPEDKAGDEKKADGGGEGEKEKKDGGGGEGRRRKVAAAARGRRKKVAEKDRKKERRPSMKPPPRWWRPPPSLGSSPRTRSSTTIRNIKWSTPTHRRSSATRTLMPAPLCKKTIF